jgi:hypothetical protein
MQVQINRERMRTMLRITIHDKPEALTFQLEGRLAGPWVGVLQESWQDANARPRQRPIYMDLSEVIAIDASGRACLSSLHRQGVEFIATDCLTKDIVDEVTRGPPAKRERSSGRDGAGNAPTTSREDEP